MDKRTRHERAVAREASIREQRYRTSLEIVTRRLKAKLDRAALAKKAGSTEAHIRAFEVGQKDPTVSELERIADALRCTVADLLPPLTPRLQQFAKAFDATEEPLRGTVYDILRLAVNANKKRGGARL